MNSLPIKLITAANVLDKYHFYNEADMIENILLRLAAIGKYDFESDPYRGDLKGEYWLRGGNAEFADGDNSDMNHEMIAEQQLLQDLDFDLHEDRDFPLSKEDANYYFQNTLDGNHDPSPDWSEYRKQLLQDDPEDWQYGANMEDYLRLKYLKGHKNTKSRSEEFDKIYKGFDDPRAHAIQHYGWQRMQGNNVEAWDLSPRSLNNLSNGIYDAYSQEGEDDDDAAERLNHMTFNVEVRSLGKTLYGVPYSEISDGSIVKRLRDIQEPVKMPMRQPSNQYYGRLGD